MSTPAKQAVINAYRQLLKTQKQVFGRDHRAIQAAKKETHARFMQFKDETNVEILDEKIALAKEVSSLLQQQNVIQGESNNNNNNNNNNDRANEWKNDIYHEQKR